MKLLPFDPERVPYKYRTTLGERDVIVEWRWNFVGNFFTLTLYDAETGELLWHRPVRYGVNLLMGCVEDGLVGIGVVPLDPELALRSVGINAQNASLVRMWIVEVG